MATDAFPTLSVDPSALRSNYRLLKEHHRAHNIAAVVKANAYGLGVEGVSRALHAEGCSEFFVATLEEAIELRRLLPDVQIAAFNGPNSGEEKDYAQHRITPVINEPGQLAQIQGEYILHVDSGMTRLGFSASDIEKFRASNAAPRYVISHLACADTPDHPQNAQQLARFKAALTHFPGARGSLANSAGIFLSPEFHFDLARPGCALYGINPAAGANPMRHVATLSAPLLQVRTLEQDEAVGYGATQAAKKGSRVAIVALGYADGWLRSLSNHGSAYIGGQKVPVLGRISMDMLALDVTAVPEAQLTRAEFINAQQTVNDIAAACGTIGYEIFTRIGRRVKRVYS